jgi:uncharacterized protein YdaU (DUF1376 family)
VSKSDSLWYPRYVGDYKRKTSHLSMTEHGAYAMLMDHYYSTSKPLPTSVSVLKRICSAFEEVEVAAMNTVLAEFFTTSDGEYHHDRADEEILKRSEISKKRRNAVNSRKDRCDTKEGTFVGTSTSTVTIEEESPLLDSPRRGTRIPADWFPSADGVRFAEGLDVPQSEVSRFRDHWLSATKNAVKKDWQAAWRNWCRNHVEFRSNRASPRTTPIIDQHGIERARLK